MSYTVTDLRSILFDAIAGVKSGSLDLDKAKMINELIRTLVDTARAENDHLKITSDSAFIEAQWRSLENECRLLRETLLDRFAMAAMTGIVAGYSPVEWLSESESDLQFILEGAAKSAFALADEMMKARGRYERY